MKIPLDGFPTRHKDIPLPTDGPWFEAAQTAFKSLRKGGVVVLYGDRGTGKTFMAYDLAQAAGQFHDPLFPINEFHQCKPRPAIYRTAMRVFLEIRDTFRRGSERSELQVMNEFSSAALLVIDEIQERGESTFEDQKLTAIIDARYQHGRPTLIIGNYATKAEFSKSVSPSILSRMQEGGGAIQCSWPSFRGTA
jgi:DNA replication protein DnaC